MEKYHKITTLWARQSEKPHDMMIGEYALPEFELLKDLQWTATEKVDGTNIRIMWDGNRVSIGGKTDSAQMPAILLNRLEDLFGGEKNEQMFEQVFGESTACLYGEGYGNKIQKDGANYLPDGTDFVLFDVKVGYWWLERENVEDVAQKFDVDVVPTVFTGTLPELSDFVDKGLKSSWGDFMAEGVVAIPRTELRNRKGERIITKLKHKDFKKL